MSLSGQLCVHYTRMICHDCSAPNTTFLIVCVLIAGSCYDGHATEIITLIAKAVSLGNKSADHPRYFCGLDA